MDEPRDGCQVAVRSCTLAIWSMCVLLIAGSGVVSAQQPASPLRVTIPGDGVPRLLDHDQDAQPLFTGLLGDDAGSLQDTLMNIGGGGYLGLFLGSSRPLSTMLDPTMYCEAAGVTTDREALCELARAQPSSTVGPRHRFDRMVAITMLARDGSPAALAALRDAAASEDRLLRLWAMHHANRLENEPGAIAIPRDDLATALAAAPDPVAVVLVVDHALAPQWRDLWRVSAEVRRAMHSKVIASPNYSPEVVAYANRVQLQAGLFPYEVARRLGDACLGRTVITTSALIARRNSPIDWIRCDGMFQPAAIAAGLREEGIGVKDAADAVHARLGDLTLHATATTLALDRTPAAPRLGAEQAKSLAAGLTGEDLAVAVEFVQEDQFAPLDLRDPAKQILAQLRRILLRQRAGHEPLARLELHYRDAKIATAAGAALGALLTLARAQGEALPAPVRDFLREVQVSCDGLVVRAEAELDVPLAEVIEAAIALAAR